MWSCVRRAISLAVDCCSAIQILFIDVSDRRVCLPSWQRQQVWWFDWSNNGRLTLTYQTLCARWLYDRQQQRLLTPSPSDRSTLHFRLIEYSTPRIRLIRLELFSLSSNKHFYYVNAFDKWQAFVKLCSTNTFQYAIPFRWIHILLFHACALCSTQQRQKKSGSMVSICIYSDVSAAARPVYAFGVVDPRRDP